MMTAVMTDREAQQESPGSRYPVTHGQNEHGYTAINALNEESWLSILTPPTLNMHRILASGGTIRDKSEEGWGFVL